VLLSQVPCERGINCADDWVPGALNIVSERLRMNWALVKYLVSMMPRPCVAANRGIRYLVARWVAIGLLILIAPVCAWVSLPFFATIWPLALGQKVHFGLALCWTAFLFQLSMGGFMSFFLTALLSQKWANAGVDLLFLAVGSVRGTCLTLLIPGFVTGSYWALVFLPVYGIGVVCGGMGWGDVVALNAVTFPTLAACCCLSIDVPDIYKWGQRVVGPLLGVVLLIGPTLVVTGAGYQYLSGLSMLLLVVAVVAFERAVRRVNAEIAGPRVAVRTFSRSRPVPRRARGDAVRTLLVLGLRRGRHLSVIGIRRVTGSAGLLVAAVVPPVASAAARSFVTAKTMQGLKSLRERRVLEDLLLTCRDERQFACTLFSVFFRPNLIVIPAVILATTIGSFFLFLVFWGVRLGVFAAIGQTPRALSWFLTTGNVAVLAIVSTVTGSAVALAHVFCLTATACEKQGRWRHGPSLTMFSPIKSRLAIVGGTAFGTLVLLCLRFAVYGTTAGFRLSEVISSHILFCLCLGLPGAFVGMSSYHRFVDNFAEWLTTTPEATPSARVDDWRLLPP